MLKTDLYHLKFFEKYFETKKITEESLLELEKSYHDIKNILNDNCHWNKFVSKLRTQEGRKSYYEIINKQVIKKESIFSTIIKETFRKEKNQYIDSAQTLTEYKSFFALEPLEVMIFSNTLRLGNNGQIVIYLREDTGYTLSISFEEKFKISIFEEFTYEYEGSLSIEELYILLNCIDGLTDKFGNISSLEEEFSEIKNLYDIKKIFKQMGLKKINLR